MVAIKRARILRDHVQLLPEARERAPVDGMAVRGAEHVWPRGVHGGVDREGGAVEETQGPGLGEDGPVVRDEEEVGGLDEGEVQPEGVHPEAVRADWVLLSRCSRYGYDSVNEW